QLFAHAVDADPGKGAGDGGERSDDIASAGAPDFGQRPRGSLTARPGDQRLRLAHGLRRRLRAGLVFRSGWLFVAGKAPTTRSAASAARTPLSQAPLTVLHRVSCAASPANQTRSRSGVIKARRASAWPGA